MASQLRSATHLDWQVQMHVFALEPSNDAIASQTSLSYGLELED
jgi:hypothetical protein